MGDPNKTEAKLLWGKFQDAFALWKEEQDQISETVEPSFCECGAQELPADKEDMELGAIYCTGDHQFIRASGCKRAYIADGERIEHVVEQSHVYYKGRCPVIEKKRHFSKIKQIKSEYQTLDGQPMEFATFNSTGYEDHVEKCKQFAADGNGKLILAGGAGRGKTHLARSIYVSLLSNYHFAQWIKAPELAELFRRVQSYANWQDGAESRERLEAIKKAECLFIDDLGTERETESDLFNEQFKLLLEEVRDAGLVITTNLDSKDVMRRYKEKIASRLLENCKTLILQGEDYRKKTFPKVKS